MTYIVIIFLVCMSAFFSGLTLGFFSLNKDDLRRKAKLGDKQAKKVFNVRKDGNLLLCTLLIGNVAVNSALSIFLGSIVSGVVAGVAATSLIVIFGEIIPQASFARHSLTFSSKLVLPVKFFIFIFYPVCKPLALMLDKILGDEMPTVYSRRELVRLIEDHEDNEASDLIADEEKIIKGALSYSEKNVFDILTPRNEVFSLPFDQQFDKGTIEKIVDSGHSRIPVYGEKREDIIAILYTKDLINNNLKGKKVVDVARNDVIFVDSKKPLNQLLNAFKKTRRHLFVVLDKYGGMSGIVTIEDVLEEIIGGEIVDEFDKYEDAQIVAKEKMKKKKLNKI